MLCTLYFRWIDINSDNMIAPEIQLTFFKKKGKKDLSIPLQMRYIAKGLLMKKSNVTDFIANWMAFPPAPVKQSIIVPLPHRDA